MTSVKRNIRVKLPVTSDDKYFYISNSDYGYPNYIYFCLEDDDFDLKYNYIKGWYVTDYPGTNPQAVVDSCSSYFTTLSYYDSYTTSSTKKYYYRFSYDYRYNYAIIYYSGYHNYGNLYVTSDDTDLFLDGAALSTVAIVFIVIGSIIVIAVAIVISACCCACCRRSQPGIMPITQPSAYVAPNPVAYGAAIPLQASPVTYSPYWFINFYLDN